MAGDWIKMRTDLEDCPEVVTLSSRCSVSIDEVIGKLQRLWSWFDRHTLDGKTTLMSAEMMDSRLGLPGFCEAVREIGWLAIGDKFLQVPKFSKHNGSSAKKRAQATKRQKLSRTRHSRVTQRRDKSVTREEKRRDSNSNNPLPPFSESGFKGILIPESLRSEAFFEAWNHWLQHRKEIHEPVYQTGAKALLKSLADWGAERSIAAIEYTIVKGWQGLAEPDQPHPRANRRKPTAQSALEGFE